MIPKTNFMLGEARFFLGQMQKAIGSGPPYIDQRILYYLDAFFNAAHNVQNRLGFEAKHKLADWLVGWKEKSLSEQERLLMNKFDPTKSAMKRGKTGFRTEAVHKGGAPVTESTGFVTIHFGQFGIQFFGAPGAPPPKVGVRKYELEGVGEAQAACRRYLELLERLVSDFTAEHCSGNDEGEESI